MIRILTTLYNSSNYIERTIWSLKLQTITDFKCYITDDLSTDNSTEIVKNLIDGDSRFELIINPKKLYQPGNYYNILKRNEIDDNDIIVTLDGDDWLSDSNVLKRVSSYYEEPIWICLGQFLQCHDMSKRLYSKGFTSKPEDFSQLRKLPWTCSHLRTFKTFLFRNINEDDLKSPEGTYWEVTGDLSFMYPMLEMAGENRVKFVEDINMIYNIETPLNDYKVSLDKQLKYAELIRQKNPYKLL